MDIHEKKNTSLKKTLAQLTMHVWSFLNATTFTYYSSQISSEYWGREEWERWLFKEKDAYLPLGFLPFLGCFPSTLIFRRHALLMLPLAGNTLITGLSSSTPSIAQAPTDTVKLIFSYIFHYPQFK